LLKSRLGYLESFTAEGGDEPCPLDLAKESISNAELLQVVNDFNKSEKDLTFKYSWRDKFVTKNVVKSNLNSLKLVYQPFLER